MKRGGRVAGALATATCALLGSAPRSSLATEAPDRWNFETGLLYYSEKGGRVTDGSVNVLAQRSFEREGRLSFRFAFDTLSGASPNGAVPLDGPQTFTTPSGLAVFSVPAGETPLDPSFHDTRVAAAVDWRRAIDDRTRYGVGLSWSDEYDYFHSGLNGRISRDFQQRNTTVDLAFGVSKDFIKPVGGAPVPLAPVLPVSLLDNKRTDDDKVVLDLLVGVTRVLGPRTLGQLSLSLSHASGYLNDAYKILSVVDRATGAAALDGFGLALRLHESRPRQRTRANLFLQAKHLAGKNVFDTSYRFHVDDWGIDSHTLDLKVRRPLGDRFYLQPRLRLYRQEAADFHRFVLFDGDPVPDHASADHRLAAFDGTTAGVKFGFPSPAGREWSLRVEFYNQSGASPPPSRAGPVARRDLLPDLDAWIVQTGYRF